MKNNHYLIFFISTEINTKTNVFKTIEIEFKYIDYVFNHYACFFFLVSVKWPNNTV